MKVLLVHGRYRSTAPSGENRVVDQEAAALSAAGHQVELFQRNSDDIGGWSPARKAALPVRTLWNGEARKDLTRRLEAGRGRPQGARVRCVASPPCARSCA